MCVGCSKILKVVSSKFHKIGNAEGYGFGTDFIFHNRITDIDLILGIEDIFSFKK